MSQETVEHPPRTPRALTVSVWALAVVGLALPVLTVGVYQHVLAGALDAQYFTSSSSDEYGSSIVTEAPGVTFWDRWTLVSYVVPIDRVLLAATAVCVLVAAVHVAAGNRFPVPRPCRWVAAAGGAVSALVALAVLGVTVAVSQRSPEDGGYFTPTTGLVELVLPVSAMVAVVVFGVVAVIVLVGGPLPFVERDAEDPEDSEEPAKLDEPLELTQAPVPVEPEPVAVPVTFPRPSAEDYARYRRPGA
ncbi:hypothetical protein OG218_14110 [Kineococcus sp. NBC_00420]|uniref:hypothetical protein n=1 Tax=Kineococcus sp. NBC_00420 TaxID=2903564 RepID=UPI002E1D5F6B